MLFLQMMVAVIVGLAAVRWAMKSAYRLGHDYLAHNVMDMFSWAEAWFLETIIFTGIFCLIFFINSCFEFMRGEQMILGLANKHVTIDMLAAGIVAKILMGAMIIQGMRIRKFYYEFVAPLRKIYLSFPKDELVRPSFF